MLANRLSKEGAVRPYAGDVSLQISSSCLHAGILEAPLGPKKQKQFEIRNSIKELNLSVLGILETIIRQINKEKILKFLLPNEQGYGNRIE